MRRIERWDLSIDTAASYYKVIDALMVVTVIVGPFLLARLIILTWWQTVRFRFIQTVGRGPADEVAARREAKRRRA